MANEKFKVKFGLAVGDTVATVDGTTGNIVTTGDLAVNGGDVTTTSTTANIVNTTATTVNIAGAGTTVSIGANTGTTTINNDLVADSLTIAGDLAVNGGDITTTAATATLFNTNATSLSIGGAATNVTIASAGGSTQIKNALGVDFSTTVGTDLSVFGNTTLGSDSSDTVTVNGLVANNITFGFNDTATPRGILGQMSTGAVDYWFVGGAETGGVSNEGYAMIATGDDGNDEIYVRQYTGSPLSGTVNRELTLLDASGNTALAGDLTVAGNGYIYSSTGLALDLTGADVRVAGDLTVDGGDIIGTRSLQLSTTNTFATTGSSISGTTLTIGTLTSGTISVGMTITGGTTSNGTVITANISGTGSGSTWTVSTSQTVTSSAITGAGNITLAPITAGSVVNTFANGGNITNNRNYVHGAIRNVTTANTNGDIWELNSSGAQSATNPFFRGLSLDNSADTTRGPATLMRSYSGGAVSGSASRGRLIFEKARGTAASPTAIQAADILGSIDVTGYTSTGWLNDTVPAVTGFFGFNAAENWVSNTALGTSFSLSLAPTTTTINTGANLVQTLSINPQTFASRSDAFTWANGKTGTTQTMSLDVSGNLIVTGDVRVNGNDIQCSSGASTITMTSANTATTVRGDTINLQTAASVGVTGNKITYNRVFGQWQYDATITPAAANTGYAVPFQGVNAVVDFANIATASNTSEIRPNALGMYKLQFSAQVQNSDNGADHQVTFWWRKNGVDISNSAGYFTVPKAAAATGSLIVGWDNMVEVTTITDYYQLIYAVSDVAVTLPYIAASAPRPGAASVFLTLVPIGA